MPNFVTVMYQFNYNTHSCVIRRPTLGPNLKGTLKFTCITHPRLSVQRSDYKRILDFFISRSLITRHGATAAVAIDARHCI